MYFTMTENNGIQIKISLKAVAIIVAMIMSGMGYGIYEVEVDDYVHDVMHDVLEVLE